MSSLITYSDARGDYHCMSVTLDVKTQPVLILEDRRLPSVRTLLSSATDVGRKRSINEDSICLIDEHDLGYTDALLLVADGMGGHLGGEVASKMTVDIVRKAVSNLKRYDRRHSANDWVQWLKNVILECNRKIYSAGKDPSTAGMGTTLTMGVIEDGTLHLAHVGDSRAYLLTRGELRQLTTDHTLAQEMRSLNGIGKSAPQALPDRSILSRAVGPYPEVVVDSISLPLVDGDTVLICSDGLHSVVPDQVIEEILVTAPPGLAANQLVAKANALGGPDNITVAIAQIVGLASYRTTHSCIHDRPLQGMNVHRFRPWKICREFVQALVRLPQLSSRKPPTSSRVKPVDRAD